LTPRRRYAGSREGRVVVVMGLLGPGRLEAV
jgi:hypothetical protein